MSLLNGSQYHQPGARRIGQCQYCLSEGIEYRKQDIVKWQSFYNERNSHFSIYGWLVEKFLILSVGCHLSSSFSRRIFLRFASQCWLVQVQEWNRIFPLIFLFGIYKPLKLDAKGMPMFPPLDVDMNLRGAVNPFVEHNLFIKISVELEE